MKEGALGRKYRDGEIICREGERGDTMYVIQSGRVKISKETSSGPIVIATLDSGEIFGEMSLFDKLPRSATAAAYGDAKILSIDRQKLFSTISNDPTLVFKMLDTMSRRIRRLNENMAGLMDAKSVMTKISFNVEDTCSMVLEEARKTVNAENGSIMLYDEETGLLIIKAAFGGDSASGVSLTVGEGIAGDVMKTGKAELLNNVNLDPRFKPGAMSINSLLCVPLKCSNHVIGVINLSNGSEKPFSIDDLKALHSMAAYAAVAIHNAKNFSNLKNATDKVIMHATMLDM